MSLLPFLVAAVALALALRFNSQTRHRLQGLERSLRALEGQVAQLRYRAGSAPPDVPAEPEEPDAPWDADADAGSEAAAASSIDGEEPRPHTKQDAGSPDPASPPAAPPRRGLAAVFGDGWEERLAGHWFVVLGGVALALGGIFLVKYSIEQGLLGPGVRVALGLVFGLALAIGGEWLRQRPLERELLARGQSIIPMALVGAGLATLYADVYAAYALYGFIGPAFAFVALGLLSLIAVGLALLHGPFVALLGVIAGHLTPALVSSDAPNALALFMLLIVLSAAAVALSLRVRAWWVAGTALAGAAGWTLLWLLLPYRAGDAPVLALFISTSALLYGAAGLQPWRSSDTPPGLWGGPALTQQGWLGTAGLVVFLLLSFIFLRISDYAPAALVTLFLLQGLVMVLAWLDDGLERLLPAAAGVALVALAAWHLPAMVSGPEPLMIVEGRPLGQGLGPVLPPSLLPFLAVSGLFAAAWAVAGFVAAWAGRRPVLWAGPSAAMPVLLLAVAYWRIAAFELDLSWAMAALLLGGLALVAAERSHRSGRVPMLAIYAAAVTACLSLALAMQLEQAWLTAALALQLPALAWIDARIPMPALRRLAMIIAGVISVRLVLNPYVLDYDVGTVPGVNWLLYGYGVPLACCLAAARVFRRRSDDVTVAALQAAALVFGVMLVSLEIRHLVNTNGLNGHGFSFAERSLHVLSWSGYALGLYLRSGHNPVARYGAYILACMALVLLVWGQLLLGSPLFNRTHVGDWPVINLLLLAYVGPATLLAVLAQVGDRRGLTQLANAAAGGAAFLVFLYLNLELRRAFEGPIIRLGQIGEGELYGYSMLWLACAGAALLLGLWRRRPFYRHAAVGLVLAAAAKVFLIDMANLTGLWRALSFVGLGLVLVVVGWLYRRYVYPSRPAPAAEAVE